MSDLPAVLVLAEHERRADGPPKLAALFRQRAFEFDPAGKPNQVTRAVQGDILHLGGELPKSGFYILRGRPCSPLERPGYVAQRPVVLQNGVPVVRMPGAPMCRLVRAGGRAPGPERRAVVYRLRRIAIVSRSLRRILTEPRCIEDSSGSAMPIELLRILEARAEWPPAELPAEISEDALRVLDAEGWIEFKTTCVGWYSPMRDPGLGGNFRGALQSGFPVRVSELGHAKLAELRLSAARDPVKVPKPPPGASLSDPIPITWLRSIVPQRVVRGASDKLEKWLARRVPPDALQKLLGKWHCERSALLNVVELRRRPRVLALIEQYPDGGE